MNCVILNKLRENKMSDTRVKEQAKEKWVIHALNNKSKKNKMNDACIREQVKEKIKQVIPH